MTLRRKLLILVGILQLVAFAAGWVPYMAYSVKTGEYRANEAFDQIEAGLDRSGLLVRPRTQQQNSDLWMIGMEPMRTEIHTARRIAYWPLVGLGVGGSIVLALGLMPEGWLDRRKPTASIAHPDTED